MEYLSDIGDAETKHTVVGGSWRFIRPLLCSVVLFDRAVPPPTFPAQDFIFRN